MSATSLRENVTVQPTAERRTGAQIMRIIAGATGVITLLSMIVFTVSALNWRGQPFAGVMIYPTGVVSTGQPVGITSWTGLDAGLQAFDLITAVDGNTILSAPDTAMAAGYEFNTLLGQYSVGDTVNVTFERQSAADTALCEGGICQTSVTLMPFPAADFTAQFIIPLIAAIAAFAAGAVAFMRRSDHIEGSLVAMIAFGAAIYMSGTFDRTTSMSAVPVWLVNGVMLGAALISLALIFPVRLRAVYSAPALVYFPLVAGVVLSLAVAGMYFTWSQPQDWQLMLTPTAVAISGLIIMLVLLLTLQRRVAVAPLPRHQLNVMIVGSVLMLIPAGLWLVLRFIITSVNAPLIVNFESLVPLLLFPVMAFLYSLLQFRRLESDTFMSQSITYLVLFGALIIAVFLLTLGSILFMQSIFSANDPLIIAVILFAMVMLFTPLRNTLQSRINRVFYRERQNLQERAEAFGQTLTPLTQTEPIVEAFEATVNQTLAPESLFVFLADTELSTYRAADNLSGKTDIVFTADSDLVTHLTGTTEPIILQQDTPYPAALRGDQARLKLIKARVIVPMSGQERLSGFIVIGPPRGSRSLYDYEQIRFLSRIAYRLAIAVERAQAVGTLEQRVRELDVLSQVGQAVNFTIGIDDLLELIYAQTTRLIEAAAFYIALYDDVGNQMYFAFLVEGDERYNEREGIRWAVGQDLWSQIAIEGRSVRVANYGDELRRLGVEQHLETDELRAWMGVPLTAGSRRLGVIAAGKLSGYEPYTDEQFKIFNNIGSLAATSLDKANLFNETRIRERQLTVLNEISRQLVAAESDVEGLLQLITRSSVDILNAEAGSLFLTAENNPNELVFRVVIGGGGQDLVGKRIDVGSGIAGTVATSGETLIVNDAADDPRRSNTLDDATNFTAENLLAVPLIAKDVVIGVLEVMNKRDGSPFVQGDADLLNAFAGQAAVAIENARLLQMQDIQLADRVQELETLERIDRNLNRTLDLGEVARITVRSAVQTLRADAGALGLVSDSPPVLRIIAYEGYDESVFIREGDEFFWALNEGIVGRVMRTRQADLVTDIRIDPDYKHGLEGALSQMTVPMISGTDITAVLVLEKASEPRFSLTNWLFAQRIAEHASIAIANAQYYAALTEANQSKNEFMGFAAHEMKTPLASVKGYADVLLAGMTGELNEQQKNFVNIIQANARRMDALISDLRDSARLDANEFRVDLAPVQLRDIVDDTMASLQSMLDDKNQSLVEEIPDDLPAIHGDAARLVQVFTNLVSNAHKYSEESATITISAEVVSDYISSRQQKLGEMIVVAVKDEGYGMTDEEVRRLFRERYFRSNSPRVQEQPGTGLGMMLTSGIVDRHGGDIRVESELEVGTTFYVALPIAPEE